MSTLTRTAPCGGSPVEHPATRAAGTPATTSRLIRLLAPTSAWMLLGVLAIELVALIVDGVLDGRAHQTVDVTMTASAFAELAVLAGLLRAAGCWGLLRGAIDAGASRRAVRRAALGVLGLLVLLQLPAGITLVVTAARTPGVVVTAPGGSAGLVLDYVVTCLGVDVLAVLARATWRGRPTFASLALLAALVVGSPTIVGDQGLLGVLQWLLPGAELLTIPIGAGLAHLGWALLVGPGALSWLITR